MNIFPSSGGIACASCGATCSAGTVPIPSRFCTGSNHVICDPCFATTLGKKPFLQPECPVRDGSSGVCGSLIADMNRISFPVYIDVYMRQWKFPCSFVNYGCPYVGNGTKVLEHFSTGCQFSHLSICNVTSKDDDGDKEPCKLLFVDSPLRKMEHMRGIHGIEFGRAEKHLVEIAMSEDDGKKEKTWHPIQIQIVDYPENRFCMLFVYENKEEVRMWLCELDPGKMGADPGARFEVTISGSSKAQANQFYGHTTRVIPYMLTGLLTEGDKYWKRCFNMEKKFLRQIAAKGADGKMRFKIKIKFDLKDDTSSSDSEGNDEGSGAIMDQKGRVPDVDQPTRVDPGELPVSLEKTGAEGTLRTNELMSTEPSSLKGDQTTSSSTSMRKPKVTAERKDLAVEETILFPKFLI